LQRTRTTTIRRLERDGPCAMWRMSNIEAVIFVAVVALMLALALWAT
jgi:transposase